MQAEGFLSRRERHPVALTAAIAINLGAVTALMLAKTEYVKVPRTVMDVFNVPVEPPPPEVIPEPIKAEVEPPVTSPEPVIRTPLPPPPQIDLPTTPPPAEFTFATVPTTGTPGGTTVTPPPKTEPVLTLAEVDPRHASAFQPPYPPKLQRLQIEGKVVLKVLVGADGRVKDVQIVSTDDEDFALVTERQARTRWRFKPATRDGAGVESWKQMTVRFEIARG